MIEEILRDFPQVEIVVSSAWRLDWKEEGAATENLRKHFSPDIAARLVGVTPDHRQLDASSSPLGEYLREWECSAWLELNRPAGTPWLALDDRYWWFRPNCPNLVTVDCDDGFMPENEEIFRKHLHRLVDESKGSK